jgi:hypothetical protein
MGAFGPGLYDDDTTCDVRDDVDAALADGASAEDAVAGVLDRYRDCGGPEVECLIWLAPAETLWRRGRLTDAVRDRALALLDRGADLDAWRADSPKSVPARRRVLTSLAKKLRGPQRASLTPRVRKKRVHAPPFEEAAGRVVSLPLSNGELALLAFVGRYPGDETTPIFGLLSWRGRTPPSQVEVDALPVVGDFGNAGQFTMADISDARRNPFSPLRDTGLVLSVRPEVDATRLFTINAPFVVGQIEAALARAGSGRG